MVETKTIKVNLEESDVLLAAIEDYMSEEHVKDYIKIKKEDAKMIDNLWRTLYQTRNALMKGY